MKKQVWEASDIACIAEIPKFIREGYTKGALVIVDLGVQGNTVNAQYSLDALRNTVQLLLQKDLALIDGKEYWLNDVELGQHMVSVIELNNGQNPKNNNAIVKWFESFFHEGETKNYVELTETQKDINKLLIAELLKALSDVFSYPTNKEVRGGRRLPHQY
jgi:hypothetical protein